MSPELEEKLYKEFPQLFKNKDLPASESCMYWGITCGDGWYNLLRETCQKFMDLGMNDLHFDQVKEKFGRLTIYTNKDVHEKVREIYSETLKESVGICEFCGSTENVKRRDGGYVRHLCPDCIENYYEILKEAWDSFVGHSSVEERRTVAPVVEGSNPSGQPRR